MTCLHLSCVTCQMSHFMCHVSIYFSSFSDKVVELVDGGYVINEAIQASFFLTNHNFCYFLWTFMISIFQLFTRHTINQRIGNEQKWPYNLFDFCFKTIKAVFRLLSKLSDTRGCSTNTILFNNSIINSLTESPFLP